MFLTGKFLYKTTISSIGLDALTMLINRFPKKVHLLTLFFVVIPGIVFAGQHQVIRVVDGQNVNLDLVMQGLSPYYTKYGKSKKYDAEFRVAEEQARKEKLNIWGDPELTKKYLRLKSKWGQDGE